MILPACKQDHMDQARDAIRLALKFESLGRTKEALFWNDIYEMKLRDAKRCKYGAKVSHAQQFGYAHSSHRDVGHRHAEHGWPASLDSDRITDDRPPIS
jgi:hypothetical protein